MEGEGGGDGGVRLAYDAASDSQDALTGPQQQQQQQQQQEHRTGAGESKLEGRTQSYISAVRNRISSNHDSRDKLSPKRQPKEHGGSKGEHPQSSLKAALDSKWKDCPGVKNKGADAAAQKSTAGPTGSCEMLPGDDCSASAPSPVDTASLWARTAYTYGMPLIRTAKQEPINMQHLPPLGRHDDIDYTVDRLEKAWQRSCEKAEQRGPDARPSLVWACASAHTLEILMAGIFALGESIAYVAQPVLLRLLVSWIQDEGNDDYGHGMGLAVGLVLMSVFQAVVHHFLYFYTMRMGWNLRIGFIGLVHKKLLTLSTSTVASFSPGKTVNLISTDVLRFDTFIPSLHFIWTSPLEVVVCTVLIIDQVGLVPGVAGIGVLICAMALMIWFGRVFARLRKRTAARTDKRVRLTSEVLSAMLSVKAYGWEAPFSQKISEHRNKEAKTILASQYMKAANASMYFFAPAIAALATFVVVWAREEPLELPSVLFVLSLMQVLRMGIGKKFSRAMESGPEFLIALQRLQEFLELAQLKALPQSVALLDGIGSQQHKAAHRDAPKDTAAASATKVAPHTRSTKTAKAHSVNTGTGDADSSDGDMLIHVNDATISWGDAFSLSHVSLYADRPQMIAVTGAVGSGKSTLLSALAGEAATTPAPVVHGGMAYAPQQPWIFSGTLRSNVLFTLPLDPDRYKAAVAACALQRDIELLPHGEDTEIGEKGVNLSGGQKARVSLARCVYSDAPIVLLDDPLAAVDPDVAEHLFTRAIAPMSRSRIVVLVTHHPHYAAQADTVLVVGSDGRVQHMAPQEYAQQAGKAAGGGVHATRKKHSSDKEDAEDKGEQSTGSDLEGGAEEENANTSKAKRQSKFVIEEDRNIGVVSARTYWVYMRSGGVVLAIFVLSNFFVSQALLMATDVWLQRWSRQDFAKQQNTDTVNTYVGLGVAATACSLIGSMLFFVGVTRSNSTLHHRALSSILDAPLSFFSANPLGRILNRFAADLGQVDELLPPFAFNTLQLLAMCLGSLVFACIAVPWIAIGVLPLFYLLYRIRVRAVRALRDLKRLDGTSRSPVYAAFSASLAGLTCIRVFQKQRQVHAVFLRRLQRNATAWFWWLIVNRWLGFRLDMLSTTVVAATSILGVALKGDVEAGLLGLALVYTLSLSGVFQFMVRLSAQVETFMTSVERLQYYISNIPHEGTTIASIGPAVGIAPAEEPLSPQGWPLNGDIKVKSLSMRYRPTMPDVLHALDFHIPAGSKVGLIGRTGSGKSSLAQTLFGLGVISGGHIDIDGINTLQVARKTLRRGLSLIPQEPNLFSGSLRFNLDPFGRHSDAELEHALRAVQLHGLHLDMEVQEAGGNFSVGQRQLLSLARAVLRRSRVVVLDEATANVDYATDALIQSTLRNHPNFRQCTLIVIAHRLQTIQDADVIIELDGGYVKAMGPPTSFLHLHQLFPSDKQESVC